MEGGRRWGAGVERKDGKQRFQRRWMREGRGSMGVPVKVQEEAGRAGGRGQSTLSGKWGR